MRLIDADKFLSQIEDQYMEHDLTRSEYMDLEDRILQQPTVELEHEKGEWIPISERLPEDLRDVLVWFEYFRYGDYNRMYSTYGIGNYSNRSDSWLVNHETGWTDLHVFAWMPMPEPPKMEGEQDESN